ncbi:dihydroneopterin aldolase [Henriciella litoralis]|uniref:dihydroneopterin aldolase n=1 Tax=Henriciella litoralis TaxID=568102 RepID=UPI000A00DC66|nr:dihydroneopterin aldolase [Henriciella litoralis]
MRRTEKVFVTNLAIHGFHGVMPQEKTLGQKFFADIECKVRREAPMRDDMEEAVNYGHICDLAHEVSASVKFNLIETLAERIASAVLDGFPLVQSVRVCIRKPNAPIRHFIDTVGVEIMLERDA